MSAALILLSSFIIIPRDGSRRLHDCAHADARIPGLGLLDLLGLASVNGISPFLLQR